MSSRAVLCPRDHVPYIFVPDWNPLDITCYYSLFNSNAQFSHLLVVHVVISLWNDTKLSSSVCLIHQQMLKRHVANDPLELGVLKSKWQGSAVECWPVRVPLTALSRMKPVQEEGRATRQFAETLPGPEAMMSSNDASVLSWLQTGISDSRGS